MWKRSKLTLRGEWVCLAVFVFFLGVYGMARLNEGAEDGGNIAITLTNSLRRDAPQGGGLRHHFPILFMYHWHRLLDVLGVPALDAPDVRQARYVTALVRSAWMNTVFGAGIVALCFAYVRRITGKTELGLLTALLVGFSTSLWLLATCAEVSPCGRFFLLLALLCSVLAGCAKALAAWSCWVASACLSGLTMLCHAPLQFFVPFVLVSALHHQHTRVGGLSLSGSPRRGALRLLGFAAVWCLVLALFIELVSPFSIWSFAGMTPSHLWLLLQGQHAVSSYSRVSVSSLLNITAAMLSVLTNWVGTVGVQEFDPRVFTRFGRLSLLGYGFSLIVFAMFGYGVVLAGKLILRRLRSREHDPKAFYLYLSLAWLLVGAASLYVSNEGVTTEHWTPVVLGAAPVLALVCWFNPSRVLKGLVYVAVCGLIVVNLLEGYPAFRMSVYDRVAYSSQDYATAFDLADRTDPRDAVIAYGLHATYWVPQITENQRPVAIVDQFTPASLQELVARTRSKGGRVWVVAELFQPDEKASRFLDSHLSVAAREAVRWLRANHLPTGALETRPHRHRFVALAPLGK